MAAEEARIGTDPRFRRRRQAVQRSKRRRLLLGGTSVLTIGVLVWAMFWSPLLSVRKVSVRGAEHVTDAEVVEATALIGADRNLLLLSTEEVARRVEGLPWVQEAEVDRMLPDSVRVSVVERRPALVLSIGAARWTLDRSGHVLTSGSVAPRLPVLAGIEVGRVEAGVKLVTPEAIGALKVFRSLPGSLRQKLAGIFAPTSERITVSLNDGTVVRIGAAERLKAKAKVLKALIERLRTRGIVTAYIDVRVPTNPAISQDPPHSLSEAGGVAPTTEASPAP